MSNEDLWLLSGFEATDNHLDGTREVSINGTEGILTVTHRRNDGNFTLKYYRLIEVEQRWVDVDE